MSKGEETRERIIEQAAPLFNKKGMNGASVSDIMEATGLKKGAIYNHFTSKEELAMLAFRYSVERMQERTETALKGCVTSSEKLVGMATAFIDRAINPPVPGGCPLLNAAIDSDDGHEGLRDLVRQAMDRWQRRIIDTVQDGQTRGEFRSDVVASEVASCFIAALEGGVMLSRLYRDNVHTYRVVEFVRTYVASLKR